jgi:predicted permease
MLAFLRKLTWWLQRRRMEDQLREELQFHLSEEAGDRQADGLPAAQARYAARRDLGNVTLLQEETRGLWTWTPLEQLGQDLRYAVRMMFRDRTFTLLATVSLALGIGANTAIYSFMDSILLRALPVQDPASLVVIKWRARPFNFASAKVSEFVMHGIDGRVYRDGAALTASIFPFPAFERLQQDADPVLSSLFAYHPAGSLNVMVRGESDMASGEYVSGDFFRGLAVSPASGRLILAGDDKDGAAAVAVISMGYCLRRFGGAAEATGQSILINSVPFIVIGVTRSGFFGVDPGAVPDVYVPMRARLLLERDATPAFIEDDYYWAQMMGRLRPGIRVEQAQAALAASFAGWVAPTARNTVERANLPVLWLDQGAAGLDSLRRQYTKPLYLLLTLVALILAIACANTANLLLARAAARRREMAVRLSIGAGRFRLVRQLLTESALLAMLGGALGVYVAMAGMRVLTHLLANGQDGFTLHADLNWRVLAATLGLSLLCGLLFGLAPAIQSTRPALIAALKDKIVTGPRVRLPGGLPRPSLTHVLVVAQIAVSLLLLVGAGLFVRTLSNLQSIPLGFNREGVLLFDVNAPQAGVPQSGAAAFYADLWRRLREAPGVRDATLSRTSIVRAGHGYPVYVNGERVRNARILITGPAFFTTMQIPILQGREIDERDRTGVLPVVVVSESFAKTFPNGNAIGRQIRTVPDEAPINAEIVGVAATVRYGGLKDEVPPVVYVPYTQFAQLDQMTFALRTDGDPLSHAATVRQIVHDADARVPVTDLRTQAADIDQTINQEIVFARLCSAFATLALVIACVGLYATMAYTVARRASEIGIRMALGARTAVVVRMVLREVCVLAILGVAIGLPIALGAARFIVTFLFDTKPNDPSTLAMAMTVLLGAALVAGYGPARRASRVNPIVALRHE